jgi:uncharacterized protein YhaN
MGSLLGGPRADDLAPDQARAHARQLSDAWALWRRVVERLRLDVSVEQEARATLQRRFFGGHDVFFADAAQAWSEHVDLVERLVNLADLLATTQRPKPRRRSDRSDPDGSLSERVAERVTWLADDARVRACEIMGDRPRAVAIMERRLVGSLR